MPPKTRAPQLGTVYRAESIARLKNEKFDVVVVGGGIVGSAVARRLTHCEPRPDVTIVEKETEPALHQTRRNSGVVHAGLYYAPGSLKARLCREGKAALETYCAEKSIPLEHTGKLVVALT